MSLIYQTLHHTPLIYQTLHHISLIYQTLHHILLIYQTLQIPTQVAVGEVLGARCRRREIGRAILTHEMDPLEAVGADRTEFTPVCTH